MKKFSGNYVCRLFFLGIAFCLNLLSFSQQTSYSTTYSGSVKDRATGYFLTGVNISITNRDTEKNIATTITNSDGYYTFSMPGIFNIKITASHDGYKRSVTNFTPEQLKGFDGRIPVIYLDTTIKLIIQPTVPVRQSREDYVVHQLQNNNIVPLPAAYDLLLYLNPNLNSADSLMSNDKINLPKLPRISNETFRDNRDKFRSDKDEDQTTQNYLRDTIDKVGHTLADDISKYKIKYEGVMPEGLALMREYIRMDMEDFKSSISRTSKLKAEGLIELISSIGQEQEKVITYRSFRNTDFAKMRLLWEDLSFLLGKSRFKMFYYGGKYKTDASTRDKIRPSGPRDFLVDADDELAVLTEIEYKPDTLYYDKEVGVFGFVVWSENITPQNDADLAKPSKRYVIRYTRPAFANDDKSYKTCADNANVAIANLTRAKYTVKVYDTEQKIYVETLYPTFETDEGLKKTSILIPDFKEVKFILIRLK